MLKFFSPQLFRLILAIAIGTNYSLIKKASACLQRLLFDLIVVLGAGIEPARLLRAQDFKSCVSTSSTTSASCKAF